MLREEIVALKEPTQRETQEDVEAHDAFETLMRPRRAPRWNPCPWNIYEPELGVPGTGGLQRELTAEDIEAQVMQTVGALEGEVEVGA